jgi:hypothetical protein
MFEAARKQNLKKGIIPVRAATLSASSSHLERREVTAAQEI